MKILVVEDSERLRRSLGHGLSKANFTVDLAASNPLEFFVSRSG